MSDTNPVQSTSNSYMSVEREENVNEPKEEVSVNVESKNGETGNQTSNKDRPWLWAKGQSGNPSGRPKGTVSITSAIKRKLREHPEELERIVAGIFAKAQDGDPAMAKLVLDRVDGPIIQKLAVAELTPQQIADVFSQQLEDE